MITRPAQLQAPLAITPPGGKTRERRRDFLCLIVICIVVFVSWLPRFQGPISLYWDAGVYYVLGTSLAQGHGYRLLNEPGDIQAIQYPPGLPALVALHQRILGTDDPVKVGIWLRRSWCALSLLYALLVFLLSRLFLSRRYAMLIVLACSLNSQMCFLSTLCFAELPFALTSTLFAYLCLKRGEGIFIRALAGSAAVISYLLRTIGSALLIAWIADAALRKQFRKAIVRAIVASIPVILWHSYVHHVESSEAYKRPYYAYQRDPWVFYNVSYVTNVALKHPFEPELGWATKKDLVIRFSSNLAAMPDTLGQAVSALEAYWAGKLKRLNRLIKPLSLSGWSFQILLILLGAVVLAGLVRMLWQRDWLIPIYVFLTIAAVCTTPWRGQFQRYLAPLESFLLIGFVTFLVALRSSVRSVNRRHYYSTRIVSALSIAALLLVGVVSAGSFIAAYRSFIDRGLYYNGNAAEKIYHLFHYASIASPAERGVKWLVTHADRNAIVAIDMPQWVYLETGLKTVMPPLEPDPQRALNLIDTVPVTYAVLDNLLVQDTFNKRFPAIIRNSPDKWHLVYGSGDGEFDIYERTKLNSADSTHLHGS
jgi:hypothetical protein